MNQQKELPLNVREWLLRESEKQAAICRGIDAQVFNATEHEFFLLGVTVANGRPTELLRSSPEFLFVTYRSGGAVWQLSRLLFSPKEVRDVRRAARAFYGSLPALNWFVVLRLADVSTRDTDSIVEMIRGKQIPVDRVALIAIQKVALARLLTMRTSDFWSGAANAVETELLALWVLANRRLRELGYITVEEELSQYYALRTKLFGLSSEQHRLALARTEHLKQLVKCIAEHIADQS
jgi:hypothetical protein